MLLILDEWLIHDLKGDNGKEKQNGFLLLQEKGFPLRRQRVIE